MWCGQCQQDVPAVVSTRGDEGLCCPRCANELAAESDEAAIFTPDWTVDDWELEQDLKELGTLASTLESKPAQDGFQRIDVPSAPSQELPTVSTRPASSASGWVFTVCGVGVLVAGAVQICWAWQSQLEQFVTTGVALAIGGQLLLTLGLILRLEAVVGERKRQEQALVEVRQQLSEQRSQASHGNVVPAPHQLLADIRARLDQLGIPPQMDDA